MFELAMKLTISFELHLTSGDITTVHSSNIDLCSTILTFILNDIFQKSGQQCYTE